MWIDYEQQDLCRKKVEGLCTLMLRIRTFIETMKSR